MKQFFALIAVGLIVVAVIVSGVFTATRNTVVSVTNPPIPAVSGENAASLKSRADSALQQALQQEADANAAAANETAQAQAASGELARAAAATAQALGVERSQLVMTADAANFSSTQSAVFAQQTQQAVEARATTDARSVLLAQQQGAAIATAQTMQRERLAAEQVASADQQRRQWISWLIPISAGIAFGLVLLFGATYLSGMINAENERRSLENQRLALLGTLFEAPKETVIFIDNPKPGPVKPQLGNTLNHDTGFETNYDNGSITDGSMADTIPVIDTEEPPVIVMLSNHDKMLADRAEAREEAARYLLAMKLLRDAINHLDAKSNRIPPAAQLGWPAGAWTIAVAILRPYGVEILPGKDGGTYLVGQYSSLQTLYIAIGEKRLTLYPPPAEIVPPAG